MIYIDKKNNTIKYAAIVVVLILVVVAVVIGSQMMNNTSSTQVEMVNENTVNPNQTGSVQGEYADGIYESEGEYVSPGGPETVGVSLTLSNGVITDAVVEVQATRPASKAKQEEFAANYKPMVVGKSIDEVMLTKVSGSSLTPKGFNDALEKIKQQAQI